MTERISEDVLDRTLREVRTLLESTVHEHRARQSRSAQFAEVGVADAAFLAAAEEVAGQAVRSVDAAFPEPSPRLAADHAALHALVSGLGDTVDVRVLRTRPLAEPGPALGPGGGLGARPAQIRIAAVALPTAVIADGRTALVCTDSADGRQASLVQDPAVVAALHGMFGNIWRTAAPAVRPLDFGNRARTEMVRRVLRRLGDGVTDEAAARELAISVRTYRRYVTGILELLEVNSRFQAGVRASELGILDRFSGGA
ncbi:MULTISPECIES: DNA-binding response regulator [Streptomyces]|uniref:DNA-binding response regulator n=1 Tax=Streptomyces lonegramiae TaxID=3075524 RepID=A0ABU2XNX5_9ACTN|nr:DNA-binding response regulator [Streptomyces sp. DSM 41529]MDT0546775.1 DNA-binding response regulator [Streptomyces sp. DSM 41529]